MAATPKEAETVHAMTPTLKTVGEENSAQEGSREIAREREGFVGWGGVGFRV